VIQDLSLIAGAIVAIVVLSQVSQTLLGALMSKGKSNNNRKGLSQTEHDIILMLSESKIIQIQIVDKLSRIVCDQQDLTKAVQTLAEHCERIAAGIQN